MVVPLTLEEYCVKPKARPPPDPVDITDFYDDDYLDDDDDDDSCDDGEIGDRPTVGTDRCGVQIGLRPSVVRQAAVMGAGRSVRVH